MEPSKSDEQKDLVFDYKALRLLVGAIAFLLPWVVIVVTYRATSSISASYHTKVRDIFRGSLVRDRCPFGGIQRPQSPDR